MDRATQIERYRAALKREMQGGPPMRPDEHEGLSTADVRRVSREVVIALYASEEDEDVAA